MWYFLLPAVLLVVVAVLFVRPGEFLHDYAFIPGWVSLVALILSSIAAIRRYRKPPKHPWTRLKLEDLQNIFVRHQTALPEGGVKGIGRLALLRIFILCIFGLSGLIMVYLAMISIGYEILLVGPLRVFQQPGSSALAYGVLILFLPVAALLSWRSSHNTWHMSRLRQLNNLADIMLAYSVGVSDFQTKRQVIRKVMANALDSTRFGLYKNISRFVTDAVCGLRRRDPLGPKSAWLFEPNTDKQCFQVTEIVTGKGKSVRYRAIPAKYFPKMLNEDKWKNDCKEKYAKEEERAKLIESRLEYGSDIGVLWQWELSELIWNIRSCQMHDNSYIGLIERDKRYAYTVRSGIVLPIPSPIDGGKPLAMLACYSPAFTEFDSIDIEYLRCYCKFLGALLANQD